MKFTLNGAAVSVDVRAGQHLLDVLRGSCGVTSVKDGCAPEGSCGACTVIVDGKAVVSCAQPAERFAGRAITTQEGLSVADRETWADCFVAAGASQCGFCSPGILMKAEVLLAKLPEPTREQVASALAGNLCRCTGYAKIIDAIRLAAGVRRGEPLPHIDHSGRVGSPTARYQGRELALGDKPYINDMTMPGMLHGAIRFADHPRAVVRAIDTGRAVAHAGVLAVLTAAEVPGDRVQGEITQDWPQLVATGETTRYVGDVIALVAAHSRAAAREAAALVEVSYDVLEPVTTPADAMVQGAPRLHPTRQAMCCRSPRSSVATSTPRSRGLRTSSPRPSRHSSSSTPSSSLNRPWPIRRTAGCTSTRRARASGATAGRSPACSACPQDKVLATLVSSGGAFGAKEDLGVQGHAALLACRTGRPVKLTLSRADSLRFHVKRHPLTLTYTVGCDGDGRLLRPARADRRRHRRLRQRG